MIGGELRRELDDDGSAAVEFEEDDFGGIDVGPVGGRGGGDRVIG